MNLIEMKYLKSACYYTETNIGDFSAFFQLTYSDNFKDYEFKDTLKVDLEKITNTYNADAFQKKLLDFYDNLGYKKNYYKILSEAEKLFNMKLDIPLYLVDKLVEPYHSRDCDGVSIDRIDSQKLKIPHGIYYVKKYLTHAYFEFVVAHEIIHQVISNTSTYQPYASMNEEGFCDLLGMILLHNTGLFNDTVLSNLLLYNRILCHNNSIWHYYLKSFEHACYYTLYSGLETVISAIKSGRNTIDTIDLKKHTNLNHIEFPCDEYSSIIRNFLSTLLYYKIPIDEYVCLSDALNSNFQQCNNSHNLIERLNQKGLLVLDNNKIILQNASFYNYMRYQL